MKRTPLVRRTPLRPGRSEMKRTEIKRTGRLERHAPLRKANHARRLVRFTAAFHSKGFVLWVKSLACSVPGCERADIQCAHVDRPRSRGGRWYEVAPLCGPHHREQEKRTDWFDRKYLTDLRSTASAVAFRWMAYARDAD